MANFFGYSGINLSFWGKIKTALQEGADKVSGKGLSTNDYTTAEKNKTGRIKLVRTNMCIRVIRRKKTDRPPK